METIKELICLYIICLLCWIIVVLKIIIRDIKDKTINLDTVKLLLCILPLFLFPPLALSIGLYIIFGSYKKKNN